MRGERARASKGGSDICWGEFWEGRGLVQDGGGGNICAGGATLRGERARASGGWICAGGRLGVLYVLGGALSRERASAGGVDMCLGGCPDRDGARRGCRISNPTHTSSISPLLCQNTPPAHILLTPPITTHFLHGSPSWTLSPPPPCSSTEHRKLCADLDQHVSLLPPPPPVCGFIQSGEGRGGSFDLLILGSSETGCHREGRQIR